MAAIFRPTLKSPLEAGFHTDPGSLVRQTGSALRASSGENLAAVGSSHSLAEAVLLGTLALLGLISAKHYEHLLEGKHYCSVKHLILYLDSPKLSTPNQHRNQIFFLQTEILSHYALFIYRRMWYDIEAVPKVSFDYTSERSSQVYDKTFRIRRQRCHHARVGRSL